MSRTAPTSSAGATCCSCPAGGASAAAAAPGVAPAVAGIACAAAAAAAGDAAAAAGAPPAGVWEGVGPSPDAEAALRKLNTCIGAGGPQREGQRQQVSAGSTRPDILPTWLLSNSCSRLLGPRLQAAAGGHFKPRPPPGRTPSPHTPAISAPQPLPAPIMHAPPGYSAAAQTAQAPFPAATGTHHCWLHQRPAPPPPPHVHSTARRDHRQCQRRQKRLHRSRPGRAPHVARLPARPLRRRHACGAPPRSRLRTMTHNAGQARYSGAQDEGQQEERHSWCYWGALHTAAAVPAVPTYPPFAPPAPTP